MKRNLVLTILIYALAAFSSEVKFALLGLDDAGKNAVELVQSQLSGQAEFVERSDIGAIHQEHFLLQQFGTAKLARQFTGADIFIAVQKNILTAFETRYGFRLAYRKLSSDLNSASAEIKAEILKWKYSGKDFFKHKIISFAGIRNNLHSSLASDAETYSRAINLAVNQTPAILLEREYLVELLLEQDLSSGWQEAVSGSEIIHFELNPGKDAEEIIFSVYAIDARNKTVFKKEAADLQSVLQALNEHCSLPPEQRRYTLKDEARRFAAEARIASGNHKYLLAEKLQFAAFALDSDNSQLFNFGCITNENLTEFFPYWFAALQKLSHHPRWLMPHTGSESSAMGIIYRIHDGQYTLPEKLRRDYWNWLNRNRNIFLQGDDVWQFHCVKPELFETHSDYLQAKENAWQILLSKNIAAQDMYDVSEELFKYQKAMPSLQRQKWTAASAEVLRRIPGLEIMAKSLECNAFLYTKECTPESALPKFEELFTMLKKHPELKLNSFRLYDYSSVNAYIGLLEKVKSIHRKHKEN